MTLIDYPALRACLSGLGLGDWAAQIEERIRERLREDAHGDMPRWREVLRQLADETGDEPTTRRHLLSLSPWRKGPFQVGSIHIDAEWRSDLKWQRVVPAVEPLHGRRVLDVGCGNGYYAMRLREAGAACVLGVDPTILYVMQFLVLQRLLATDGIWVLPLRLEELPPDARAFDTAFSMGVLYHQRSPLEHLRQLRGTLRPGGQLVLETIYLPGDEACACTPPDRYARMRNVWLLPTIPELITWLRRSGFRQPEIVDKSRTTPDEQRRTEWMRFDSLSEALHPDDPERTVEGWPAPRRVVVLAKAP